MFKVGTPVRQIVKPVEGTVKKLVVVDEGTELEYLVEYEGSDGELVQRHFKEHEIEATNQPEVS